MAPSDNTTRRHVWIGVAGITLLLVVAILLALAGAPLPLAHAFYIPSEAMEPTLLKNDRLLAVMRPPNPLKRGAIILFRNGEATYTKRIAALPGDTIALVDGRVLLNGSPVPQQAVGTRVIQSFAGPTRATRLREHFPGEDGDHFIYDSGPSPEDNFGPQVVAPGHVFVLGDNRDDSADSRVPRAEMGVEQLPISDITGTPIIYTWGPSHKFGETIH